MGQYFIAVNLDKKQFISPSAFGDGPKMIEFCCSRAGFTAALALLCSSGNGSGGGDIYRQTESKRPIKPRTNKWERIHHSCETTDHTGGGKLYHYQIVPMIAGEWAGQRVVCAGDYSEPGKFLTQQQIDEYRRIMPDRLRKRYQSEEMLRMCGGDRAYVERQLQRQLQAVEEVDADIHHYAKEFFEDISEAVFRGLCVDECLRSCVAEDYANDSRSGDTPKFLLREVGEKRAEIEAECREQKGPQA